MRNTLFFLTLLLSFVACDDVGKFHAPIEELSSNWKTTTAAVMDFAGNLEGEEAKAKQMLGQIVVPDQADEAVSSQATAFKSRFQENLKQLTALKEKVLGFVAQWQGKTKELNEMKEGLNSGKLGADTMEKVGELQEMVSTAKANLDQWKSEFTDIQTSYTKVYEEFTAMAGDASVEGN